MKSDTPYLIQEHLCKNFKFYSNLDFTKFPKHYQEILYKWKKLISPSPDLPSDTISKFIWFNKKYKLIKHMFFSQVCSIKV